MSYEQKDGDEGILRRARELFIISSDYFSEQHRLAREDIDFRNGNQWNEEARRRREQNFRPVLTNNQIPTFIDQVVNAQMNNMPSIQVHAVDSDADPKTALVLQSMIKTIEAQSSADLAYANALEQAATSGLGFFRLATDYNSPNSMNQDIQIKPVLNSFAVLLDPYANDPLFADGEFGFVFENVAKESYKQQYPNSECYSDGFEGGTDEGFMDWVSDDSVRVAEYFYVEHEEFTLVQLQDGKTLDKKDYDIMVSEVEKTAQQMYRTQNLPGLMAAEKALPPLIGQRKSSRKVIHHIKTNGYEILERTIWPGNFIPLIPVMGSSYVVNGKRVFEGVVRHAKDPQRMVNYWKSCQAEMIALAPKAPYVGVKGQFEGMEEDWQNANVNNAPYLEYNPVEGGQPPQRQNVEPPIQAITVALQMASEDLKSTTGIYDISTGNTAAQESGLAVLARMQQASVSTTHFGNNLGKSVRLCGKMIIDLLPKIYDARRTVRMVGNEKWVVEMGANIQHDPDNLKYRLGLGQYDVMVDASKSSMTMRQQSLMVMNALIQTNPEVGPLVGDLITKNLDIPEADEISDRLKRLLPPSVTGEELPAEVQQQINQIQQEAQAQIEQQQMQGQMMQQMIAQLTSKLNEVQAKLDSKQMETESKERIAVMQMRNALILEMAKGDHKMALAALTQGMKIVDTQLMGLDPGQGVEPQMDPTATDTYVIPGVNDPVTQQRQANEEKAAATQQRMEQGMEQIGGVINKLVAPPNLRPNGPTQLGGKIQRAGLPE